MSTQIHIQKKSLIYTDFFTSKYFTTRCKKKQNGTYKKREPIEEFKCCSGLNIFTHKNVKMTISPRPKRECIKSLSKKRKKRPKRNIPE